MAISILGDKEFEKVPSIKNKVLRVNLNENIYGTFAEIGAGQETVRHFFRSGGDSGTIAKAMSAYDKDFSDAIYGIEDDGRYVTEKRLKKMLTHEMNLIEPLEVVPIQAYHGELPVFGYRFGTLAYLTDVKTIDDAEIEKLQGLDILVINALRYEPHKTHLNVEEALELVDKIKPKTTYFTHISHHLGFHAEVEEQLPDNVHLAYDGLILSF